MDHLSLLELNRLLQDTFKKHLEPSYWVIAEIGAMSVNQSGHCYLELIQNEENKIVAKTKATIWSYKYRNLSTWFQGITGQPLAEGLRILVNVKINLHELYGFSLNIQDIDASFTVGEKERKRQEVINQLREDGVYGMNKDLMLPLVPQRIAIISAPNAAGYGDFLQHLVENPYHYKIKTTLFDSLMQGEEAPASIINALVKINNSSDFDLVVLIRGGGSQLDLECFNDYDLCSHLAQFPLPIITGIGHERDDTIADMVAHSKLKTPTAVAEFIIQGIASFEGEIDDYATSISKVAGYVVQNAEITLQNIENMIRLNARAVLLKEDHKINESLNRLRHLGLGNITLQSSFLDRLESSHKLLNPKSSLKRGFSFSTVSGKPLRGTKVENGNVLTTVTLDKIIKSTITSIKTNDKN